MSAGAHLTRAVVAGGVVFPTGTVREGHAAEVIPAGAWWSDGGAGMADPEPEREPDGGALFDPAAGNQDRVIEHLEREDIDDDERDRVLAAEATREGGTRQKVEKWAKAREAAKQDTTTPPAGDGDAD